MSEPQWQTCPKCGERWWDSHVCRNTLNSLTVALAPTCRFCGQAARAQPAQAGQVLTDEEIEAAIRPFYRDSYSAGMAMLNNISEYLAVEQAVLAKRVPMTNEQLASIYIDWDAKAGSTFAELMRAVERHHGIVGEKGGA